MLKPILKWYVLIALYPLIMAILCSSWQSSVNMATKSSEKVIVQLTNVESDVTESTLKEGLHKTGKFVQDLHIDRTKKKAYVLFKDHAGEFIMIKELYI